MACRSSLLLSFLSRSSKICSKRKLTQIIPIQSNPFNNVSTMKLHVLPISANSHGPLAIVKHLNLHTVQIIDAMGKTRTPEFIAMNPAHCCPTLQFLDGSAIWESSAVMRCLCNIFDTKGELYPSDAEKKGKIDMVIDWRNSSFYPDLFHIVYMMFGVDVDEDQAKVQFKKLMDNTFLNGKKFCFSDTPTIADLSVAPLITLLKGRKKFWATVPDGIKEYYERVLEAFPGMMEYVKLLDDKAVNYDGPGADAEP
ncbi:hypothetical protein ACHAWO_010403 [Cyclotella atomus]|uniref:GST C-terminal domain-containing protein n=1 Tax=Cyclotella atomus TaxID=382360 RepID=A0ABD3MVV7_9STRA